MENTRHNQDTAIIIPSAGKGTRLGLVTSKEVFQVEPEKKLIDYSLEHVRRSSHISRVIFIIHPLKIDLINYLYSIKKTLPPIGFVFQKDNYFDWPGAVWSAEDFFDSYNVVLLPDSVLTYQDKNHKSNLIDSLRGQLKKGSDIVFAYKEEADQKKIGSLGALHVDKATNMITQYKEKPDKNQSLYNSFWCSFSFKKKTQKDLFSLMTSLAKKEGGNQRFKDLKTKYKVKGVPIKDYHDLGTWENLQFYIVNGGVKMADE